MEELVKRGLTTQDRIERSKSVKVIGIEGDKGIYVLRAEGNGGKTHISQVDLNTGKYDCSCEDFVFRKVLCIHLLRLLSENRLWEKFLLVKDMGIKEEKKECISTGCRALDDLLGGGIPFATPTLIYGAYDVGKSILCVQIASKVWQEMKRPTLFIDTEQNWVRETDRERVLNWFRKRFNIPDFTIDFKFIPSIEELLAYFGWNLRIRYAERSGKVDTIITPMIDKNGFKIPTEQIPVYKDFLSKNYGLVVLDSITMLTEGIFGSGLEQLPGRKPILANIISDLRLLAVKYNIPVVITAHLSKGPQPTDPATFKGGSALGFGCKYIVRIGGGEKIGPRWFERDRAGGLEPGVKVTCELRKDEGFY
ncbi:MAG: ATPase domain-containing protein [Candidatus Micrarchaeia archaeon]